MLKIYSKLFYYIYAAKFSISIILNARMLLIKITVHPFSLAAFTRVLNGFGILPHGIFVIVWSDLGNA